MPQKSRIVSLGPNPRSVCTEDGKVLAVPDNWELLPPGDPAWTRRVKSAGPCWSVRVKKGRRTLSHGVWAPADRIARIKSELETERSSPSYAKRRSAAARRRERTESAYVKNFRTSVMQFLNFAACHTQTAERLADAVTLHASPVGSGTVARTKRIPIDQRAESAVIAWLRHQTTDYEQMQISRVKGQRREVRAQIARQSRKLLSDYRTGAQIDCSSCPLQRVLNQITGTDSAPG